VTYLAAGVEGSNPILNLTIFGLFVIITLAIVIRVSKRASSGASDFYTAGGGFSGPQNGVAISGDYLSAASFLGIAGAIAINGYDGFLYSIGFLVAWLVALLLVAELLRNTGTYTMGDVLAFRMRQRPVRAAAATPRSPCRSSTCSPRWPAPAAWSPCCSASQQGRAGVVIAIVGAVMIVYVLIGGMSGTTWVQIIKAVLLIAGAGIMTVWVLAMYGFNLSALLGRGRRARRAARACWRRAAVRQARTAQSTSSRCAWRSCSAPRACRTSSCASTRCRRPRRPAARWSGRSG
jgi:cation/acetate symporter